MSNYGTGTYGSGSYSPVGTGGGGGGGGSSSSGGSGTGGGGPSIYRYICADLVTNAILAELPFREVSFERRLNDIGTFTGILPIADPGVLAMQPIAATQPGRTAIYIDRDGVLIWGGIVVTRTYEPNRSRLAIGASEFFWYFKQKRLLVSTKTYTNQDQLAIAQDLLNYAQSVAGGSIGVIVPTLTSGVLRSQSWSGFELKPIGQAIIDLSQLDNGFDFAIDVSYISGLPAKALTLSYPRRGAIAPNTGWVFEYPGNIVDFSWPEDSSLQAITAYVQGSGTGASMISSSSSTTALIDGGYPLLEQSFPAKDQTDPSVIGARAVAASKAYANPVVLPQLMVRADLEPVLGSYTIGDDCQVVITDPRFPLAAGAPGLSGYYRITAIRVQPQDNLAERVALTLGSVLQ